MPNIYANGDMLEVQVIGTVYGQICMNVLHLACKSGPIDGAALATELNTGWCSALRSVYAPNWTWTMYKHRRVSPDPATDYETTLSNMLVGLGSGNAFPPQLCMLWAVKTTDVSLNPLKGRIYHPALPNTTWQSGNWTATFLNTCTTVLTNVLNRYKNGGSSSLFTLMVRQKIGGGAAAMNNLILRPQPAVIRARRIST